jgi:hypothetical protein
MRTATVASPTTGISPTGSGVTVPAGTYEVLEFDAAVDTVIYVRDAENNWYCLNATDSNVTISEG